MKHASSSKAAVLLGPRRVEIQRFPLPEIGPDDGLLRVEATGVCGADWPPYLGERYDFFDPPLILGHEIVGRIERIGEGAAQRWGVETGDRVVLEEPLPCGECDHCRQDRYMLCAAKRYGCKSINEPPALWGGFSEYVYLDPRARVHRMDARVPVELAPLYVPISNGLYWVEEIGGATPGCTVLIQGPGQQGLGCVVGAREAGAGRVIVVGLGRDAERLALAKDLGAHYTIRADEEDVLARVAEVTGGRMADVVLNVTANAPQALAAALDLAAERGTIVVAGAAHGPTTDFQSDKIWKKELTIRGVRGRYAGALKRAIRLIESGVYPLERMSTHSFPVEETERALKTVGGEGERGAIHVSVVNR